MVLNNGQITLFDMTSAHAGADAIFFKTFHPCFIKPTITESMATQADCIYCHMFASTTKKSNSV